MTDPTPLLIALLQARAEGDDETADELADIMADDEHAAAVLEQAERGDVESEVVGKSAKWEESKHPRASDGKFGSGGTTSKAKLLSADERKAWDYVTKKPTQKEAEAEAERLSADGREYGVSEAEPGKWRVYARGGGKQTQQQTQPDRPKPVAGGRANPATEAMHAAIDSAVGLSDAQKVAYKKAAYDATKRMPPKAVEAISKSVKATNFHANLDSLRYQIAQDIAELTVSGDPNWLKWLDNNLTGGLAAARRKTDVAAEWEKKLTDMRAAGAWINENGNVYLDGATVGGQDATDIYAHELTHAIDAGRVHSDSRGWAAAFKGEIDRDGDPLSGYARTSPTEGFAEFGRLVYTSDTARRREVERQFPKAAAYFKENGLWPS